MRDLVVPANAGPQRVVLGFEEFENYRLHSPHFGANPGRVANRIGNGRFTLDGVGYEIDKNQDGKHTLHGGAHGFSKRPWSVVTHDTRSVTLALVSDDGDMGFPGRVIATCTYVLLEPATLHIVYTATTDKATPVNLAHHSYFNLDGEPDILDHHFSSPADFYTPTDADLIPTGEILFGRRARPMISASTGRSASSTDDGPIPLRHEFRAAQRQPPRPCRDGLVAKERRDDGSLDDRARLAIL